MKIEGMSCNRGNRGQETGKKLEGCIFLPAHITKREIISALRAGRPLINLKKLLKV